LNAFANPLKTSAEVSKSALAFGLSTLLISAEDDQLIFQILTTYFERALLDLMFEDLP